jgi:hypothetical protein
MTEYTDIETDRSVLTVKITGHASQYDAEKLIFQHSHLTYINLKAFKILQKITNALRMMAKRNGLSFHQVFVSLEALFIRKM